MLIEITDEDLLKEIQRVVDSLLEKKILLSEEEGKFSLNPDFDLLKKDGLKAVFKNLNDAEQMWLAYFVDNQKNKGMASSSEEFLDTLRFFTLREITKRKEAIKHE